MKKLTITQFAHRFPNDDACLQYLWELRHGSMQDCPECNKKADFAKVKGRPVYQCTQCNHQISPMAGTIFQKSTTPLIYWFTAIYLFTTTRNGVAAKELERQFDICYKTALRMAHQIKILIGKRTEKTMTGIVEADEMYLGGKFGNMHAWKRGILGNNKDYNKTIVFGMLERNGEVIALVVDKADRATLKPMLQEKIESGSILVTDNAGVYRPMSKTRIKHYVVNHEKGEYVRGILHTNTIEGFWSQVKRTICGTHIHVSKTHLQKYLNECSFRYKMRNQQDKMFDAILSLA
jgi:transposase